MSAEEDKIALAEEEEDESQSAEEEEQVAAPTKKKEKRMKRAMESIGKLTGSTHSNPDVISTIMVAQHRVFGPLKLDDLGPEEKSRSRTHVNPLSRQYLEVS